MIVIDGIDIGDGHHLLWDRDGQGFIWNHPKCRAWAALRFYPDPESTGHRLESGGPEDMEHFTIAGSLLCPMGCGEHGYIRNGRWVQA